MTIMQIQNLSYYYPEAREAALRAIDLQVREGEFLLLTGGSGSGKSSLARAMAGLIPHFYGGRIGGRIIYRGQDLRRLPTCDLARNIGMVFQDPERQLLMTRVESEIAFGLENLGLPRSEMARRIAEVMSFFELSPLQGEFTARLSGGQKQKLALASVMAMQPRVLILDEPSSQLDPRAAEEIINLVKRLNEELNITIILIEQRLERCFHLADRVAVMEAGRLVKLGTPAEAAVWEVQNHYAYVPVVAGFFARIEAPDVPLTIKAGRRLLCEHYANRNDYCAVPGRESAGSGAEPMINPVRPGLDNEKPAAGTKGRGFRSGCFSALKRRPGQEKTKAEEGGPLIEVRKLWFAYPNGQEALRGIDLSVNAGEFWAVIGENGSGKTTLLKQMAGILRPGRGQVKLAGLETDHRSLQERARLVGYLSQNPDHHLFHDSVEEELQFTQQNLGRSNPELIVQLLEEFNLLQHRHHNPRDLSSGERQRAALASVLAAAPGILLLDEPTRGLDYDLKAKMGRFLAKIAQSGAAVIMVTHDVDFAAEHAERLAIMFDGRISCAGSREKVMASSMFYAPQIRKLFNGINDRIFTVQEAVQWALSAHNPLFEPREK